MSIAMEHAVAQEAGTWLFRLKDDHSSECQAEFSRWLQSSPRHVAEFLLVSAADVDLGALGSARHIDVGALLADGDANVAPLPGAAPTHAVSKGRIVTHSRSRLLAMAAGIAAISLVTILAWRHSSPAALDFRTGIGEQRTVKLDDGSVVNINTRSRIEVSFSADARVVQLLEGEALFTVARDAARPFEVRSGATTVQAVGTQFNVYRQEDGAKVSVVEGRVKVVSEERSRPLMLDAGQEADIGSGGRIVKAATPEVAQSVAWRRRQLEFHSTTVGEVARQFNRYNRVQIRIADEAIATRSMSGLFEADDPESFIEFLKHNTPAEVVAEGEEWVIRARPGPGP